MNKKFTPLLVCVMLLVCGYTSAQDLKESHRINQFNGKPKFVKFEEPVSINTSVLFSRELEITEDESFRVMNVIEDRNRMIHERHQQYYKGIPVEQGTYIVHKDNNGRVVSMNGEYKELGNINTNPSISPDLAFNAAVRYVGAKEYMWNNPANSPADYSRPQGSLVIVDNRNRVKESGPLLAYKFDIYASNPISRADVYVDAQTGEIIKTNSKIHDADAVGTAATRYSGSQSIHTDSFTGGFRLRDSSRGNGVQTFNMNGGSNYNSASDYVDNNNNWTASEWNNSNKDNAALDAHWGAEMTYDFFSQTFGRNSYDGSGALIRSYANTNLIAFGLGSNDNAFWDGSRMTYGSGSSFDPLTTLDVCAHEIGHAVCTFSANLEYERESGAMNEGFSDIWAACVENFAAPDKQIWLLAEDVITIRDMANPKAGGQPDTYGGTNWINPNCGTPTSSNDYCGVHTNSGVLNHWFYILSEGKTGTNDIGSSYSVTGIGIQNAAAIAYQLETAYLTVNSDYADARTFGIQSAIDLFGEGSDAEIATTNAFYAVGIGGPYGEGPTYCSSAGENANFEWISSVSIGSFTNNSGLAGYSDFTGQTVTIGTGSTPVSLTPGFSGQTYNEYWRIWIDLNDDKDFNDANELVFDAGSMSSSTVTGNLTVPSSAGGITTRMRVTMKYNGAPTSCEVFDYGEVEDYTVTITGGTPDTQAPSTPGNLSASNITTSAFDVSWNASSDNVGVSGYDVYLDGSFDGSTSGTSYSFSGLSASTSYDVDVVATDAAGNESSPASISVTTAGSGSGETETLMAHFFESGWDGWSDGGSDCFRYNGAFSWEGDYSIRLRDNSGTASAMTSAPVDLSGFSSLSFQFYFYPNSMESGEDFWVRYNDGSGWQTIASYASGSSFDNGSFYVATIDLTTADINFVSNARFRIQCDASTNSDQVYIDEITLTASTGSTVAGNALASNSDPVLVRRGSVIMTAFGSGADLEGDLTTYPNPTTGKIKLFTMEAVKSIKVHDTRGVEVKGVLISNENELDVSTLKTGIYIVTVETEEETIKQRIIKQ